MFKRVEEDPSVTGVQDRKKKEVILEDNKTGDVRVVQLGEIPGITGGTREGIWGAIKNKRIYKRRYIMKYVKKDGEDI